MPITNDSERCYLALRGQYPQAAAVNIYRFAFDQSPSPAFHLHADGRISDANNAACTLLGYRKEQLSESAIWDLVPNWSSSSWTQVWQTLTDHAPKHLNLTLRDAADREIPVGIDLHLHLVGEGPEALLYAQPHALDDGAQRELERLRELLDVSESIARIGHWRLAIATGRPQWSRQVFEIFRRDPALGEPDFKDHAQYVEPDDWRRLRSAVNNCATLSLPYALTVRIRRSDGSKGAVRVYGSALPQRDAQPIELVGFVLDISEQEEASRRLLDVHRQLNIALDAGQIGIYRVNFRTGEASGDARYFAMLGYAADELSPTLDWWREQIHPGDAGTVEHAVQSCLKGESDRIDVEYRMRHRAGHWVWIEDHAQLFERDRTGRSSVTIGVHLDISQRKRAERKLRYRANYDPLTRLPNRRSFWATLRRVHAQSRRTGDPYCIAILDLDLFKSINDNYGHLTGDRVLASFARLLRHSVREADWAARWGGEEFIVLMPETDAAQAHRSMERLRGAVCATTFKAGEYALKITVSIGIGQITADDQDCNTVITRADRALYEAKHLGRNQVCCTSGC